MPSSSLFLRSSTTLVSLFSLATTSFAAPQNLAARGRPNPTTSSSAPVYTIAKSYSGSNFFNEFNFFDTADPTHGFVTYVDEADASKDNLIGFDGDYAVISIDSTTNLGKGKNYYETNGVGSYYNVNGVGRKSVRIEGTYQFTHGLILADIGEIPAMCGTWPAFWTLGEATWPTNGEIDIIEGANAQSGNWMTLHDNGNGDGTSTINPPAGSYTASLTATDCNVHVGSTDPNYTGCKFEDQQAATFSQYKGGVWATQWTSKAIQMWYWPYGSVPNDVTNGKPQPGSSAWGTPRANFAPNSDLNIDANFINNHIIFDTTFCGDLGDATWNSTGCGASTGYASCADYVANEPTAFKDAKWKIKYVDIYEVSNATSTTTTTSSSSSTTSPTSISTSTTSPTSISTSTTSSTSISTRPYGNATTTGPTSLSTSYPYTGQNTWTTTTASESGSGWGTWSAAPSTTPVDTMWDSWSAATTGKPATTTKQGGAFYPGQPDGKDQWITTTVTDVTVVPCSTAPGYETKTYTYTTVVPASTWSSWDPTTTSSTSSSWGSWDPSTSSSSWGEWDGSSSGSASTTGTWSSWVAPTTSVKATSADPSWSSWTGSVVTQTVSPVPVAASSWATWVSSPAAASTVKTPDAASTATGTGSWSTWNTPASATNNIAVYKGAASTFKTQFVTVVALALFGGMIML